MEATSREPENSGWYRTIQNSNGVSFNVSKDFYQKISINNQTRINNT